MAEFDNRAIQLGRITQRTQLKGMGVQITGKMKRVKNRNILRVSPFRVKIIFHFLNQ